MNIGQGIEEVRKVLGDAANLAFTVVRAPGAIAEFAWWTISHEWNERRAKHGRVLDVASVLSGDDPWLPNGRDHH